MSPPERRGRPTELVEFALERLPAMRRDDGVFCHEVAAPSLEPRGRSLRYTLIVLLGLLRAEAAGLRTGLDPAELKGLVIGELGSGELRAGDLGLLLWADARSGLETVAPTLDRLSDAVRAAGGLRALVGLELSWVLTGCAAALAAGATEGRLRPMLLRACERQLARAETPSGLFLHQEAGPRARFPNFATEIYGVLALVEAARAGDDERCLKAARRAADRLVALQLEDGAWPWLYDARRGRVVERYEVYSVHQDAMAPMALQALAEATGEARQRDAAMRGLEWIWGKNALGIQMLDREAGVIWRSIRRRPPLDRLALYANTATSYLGQPLAAAARGPLVLNRTDRPYHLGWVLEAWASQARPMPD